MDVNTAFLNRVFDEEELYIELPQGFEVPEKESHIHRLKKALHGLKKAPQAWYPQIDGYPMSLGC